METGPLNFGIWFGSLQNRRGYWLFAPGNCWRCFNSQDQRINYSASQPLVSYSWAIWGALGLAVWLNKVG